MNTLSPYERFGQLRPTTDAGLEEYVFAARDTLSGLAHRKYGDWRMWREIAERNELVDVRQIEPGTKLLIPERSLEMGAYESIAL
jgi:nucleoid-associated protein YgaU